MSGIFKIVTLSLVLTMIFAPVKQSFSSDEEKKVKPRISVDYYKDMEEGRSLSIKALARGEKGYDPAADLNIDIFQNLLDSVILLGSIKTDAEGRAIFDLSDLNTEFVNDTLGLLSFEIKSKEQGKYKSSKKSLDLLESSLIYDLNQDDSIPKLKVKLEDFNKTPIQGITLKIFIDRSFAPLPFNNNDDESNSWKTNNKGEAIIPLNTDLPQLQDGSLTFLVKIIDHDDYGNVQTSVIGNFGSQYEQDLSFYTERTMWATRDKTPLWLLIFPNAIILTVWGTILYLIFQLFLISKFKHHEKA